MAGSFDQRLLFGVFLLTSACGSGQPDPTRSSAPTVFLIAIDDLRPDRLSFHGPKPEAEDEDEAPEFPATTPFLASLARTSAIFDDCVTPSTSSSAALATILTGKHPTEHGLESVQELGRHRLHARHRTLAEAFREAGWSTVGWVGTRQFQARLSGFERGFERYFDDEPSRTFEGHETSRPWALKALLARRKGELVPHLKSEKPLFFFLQCADLREEQAPPADETRRLLEERLRPHVEALPELGTALAAEDVIAAVARLLGRRRGSPLWSIWREAMYDARLLAMDAALAQLVALVAKERDQGLFQWVVVGTRGCYLLESRPDAPEEGFSEGLLRTGLFAHLSAPGLALEGRRRIVGLTSAQRIAPSLARACGLSFELEGAADLSAGPLDGLLVLSPRAGLALEVEQANRGVWQVGRGVPHGGVLRLRSDGQPIVVRDPSGSLLSSDTQEPAVRLTRDGRRADVRLAAGEEATLITQKLASPLVLEFPDAAPDARSRLERVDAAGAGAVAGLPVPRLPAARGEPWDVEPGDAEPGDAEPGDAEPGDGNTLPWRVDLLDAGGGWVRLRVSAGASGPEDVRVYCALYPPAEDPTEPLRVKETPLVERRTAASLPGAACVSGRTPFEVEVNLSGRRLALAVECASGFVATSEIRYLGRRFDGGVPALYLPPWLPQRMDWFFEAEPLFDAGRASGAAEGRIWFDRGLEPSAGPWDLSSDEVRFLQRLRNE